MSPKINVIWKKTSDTVSIMILADLKQFLMSEVDLCDRNLNCKNETPDSRLPFYG